MVENLDGYSKKKNCLYLRLLKSNQNCRFKRFIYGVSSIGNILLARTRQ
jgi:hypothetical protein